MERGRRDEEREGGRERERERERRREKERVRERERMMVISNYLASNFCMTNLLICCSMSEVSSDLSAVSRMLHPTSRATTHLYCLNFRPAVS